MKTYKDLLVWKMSCDFTTKVYKVTKTFPEYEIYGLVSQLRRASVSIPSNLAEGSKRGKKEFCQFIRIAQGSGAEIETQIIVSRNIGYIKEKEFTELIDDLESIMKMMTNLLNKISL